MAYVPNSGSVVAFQGNPSVLQATVGLMSTNASVITVGGAGVANQSVSGTVQADIRGSVATVIIGGSIAASFTPPANQSVSGAVSVSNFPTTQNISGSVVAWLASTNASIITVGTAAANQSVSGTVQTDVRSSVAVVIIGGSILTSSTANQSVSGTVGASVIGTVPVTQVTSPWTVVSSITGGIFPISGSVAAVVTNFPTTQNVSGSVAAWLQSTNASVITVGTPAANQSVSGTVHVDNFSSVTSYQLAGSVLAVSGSFTPAANQSVSGTVGASIIGHAPVVIVGGSILTASTANQSVSGTVGASIIGTVPVTQATTPWTIGSIYGNISGSVAAFQIGTTITSLVSTVPSSVIVGTSIFGQLPAGTAPLGSVATLQGTNPWVVVGSVYGNVSGSVIAFQGGTQITSISGIPQASVHGTVALFPASMVSGHGSVNGAASVQILAAPGAGLYNYVTDISLANTGAATTLVTITDGDSSTLGKLIAPAGGGAVMASLATPMRTMATNKVVNISAATATSVLHAWIGGYRNS